MRFKGIIAHIGMRALENQFLPCLEKFGKQCYILLTPEDFYILQDSNDADGIQTSARLEHVSRVLKPSSDLSIDLTHLFFVGPYFRAWELHHTEQS